MKKRKLSIKLSRGSGARKALKRALIAALVKNGKIVTTKAKAKFVQRIFDKIVAKAKTGGLAKRREVLAFLGNDRKTVDGIFNKIIKDVGERKSGFTRMINLPRRRGDNAEMVRLEVVRELKTEKKTKKGKELKKTK